MLANLSQIDQLATVIQWADQVGIPSLLQQLDAAESRVYRAQCDIKKIKKILEEGLALGLRRKP